MIIDSRSKVENNLNLTTTDFTIKTTPQAFKILSSSLYENKPKAVLRELSANALDAHIAANCSGIPIKITLPTSIEPTLKVEDSGIGLSKEDIINIYNSYFSSTKSESNDVIGGFGLGSKSPFSISETFTLRSVKNGEVTEALQVIDNAVPKCVILNHTTDSKEANGTTITVPVENPDYIAEINKQASTLFLSWEVKPILLNEIPEFKRDVYFEESILPSFFVHNYYSYGVSLFEEIFNHVIVGPFMYAIPKTMLLKIKEESFSVVNSINSVNLRLIAKYLKDINTSSLSIAPKFDIGEIELPPSRERIEITEKNTNIIKQKIVNFVSEFYSTVKSKNLGFLNELASELKKMDYSLKSGFTYKQKSLYFVNIGLKYYSSYSDMLANFELHFDLFKDYEQKQSRSNITYIKELDHILEVFSKRELPFNLKAIFNLEKKYFGEAFGYVGEAYSKYTPKCIFMRTLSSPTSKNSILRKKTTKHHYHYSILCNSFLEKESPLFILKDNIENYSNSQKAIINNAFKTNNFSIKYNDKISVSFDNYLEFTTDFKIENVIQILEQYYEKPANIIYLDLEFFKEKIETKNLTKDSSKVSKTNTTRNPLKKVRLGVLQSSTHKNSKPVSVGEFYDKIVNNYDITYVVSPANKNPYTHKTNLYSLKNTIFDSIFNSSCAIVLLDKSIETQSKRFQKLLQDNNKVVYVNDIIYLRRKDFIEKYCPNDSKLFLKKLHYLRTVLNFDFNRNNFNLFSNFFPNSFVKEVESSTRVFDINIQSLDFNPMDLETIYLNKCYFDALIVKTFLAYHQEIRHKPLLENKTDLAAVISTLFNHIQKGTLNVSTH